MWVGVGVGWGGGGASFWVYFDYHISFIIIITHQLLSVRVSQ